MKVTHDEYLKRTLRTKKMELTNLNIEHRIAIAKHEVKKDMLQKEIDSIERQLSKE